MTFIDIVNALYYKYNKNIKLLRDESTLLIFNNIFKNPSDQVYLSNVNSMKIGKIYIIRYNYNGNKLWCPILTIPPLLSKNDNGVLEKQLKTVNNKNLLYALNFDYLPIQYKIILIDNLIKSNQSKYDNNLNCKSAKDENSFKVNWIYEYLKVNGKKNYSITAFDILKIDQVYDISSNILDRFCFIDTYYINNRLMYDTLSNIEDSKLKSKFINKIKSYENIIQMYENDIEIFYKSLRAFENSLKLIDNY